jgi:branched-chain amino acid transport system substrate-binding protein
VRDGAKTGRKIEVVPFDNKGTVQDALIVFQQARDQNIAYFASTVSSIANALSDAIVKYNARNPTKPVLFLDFDARDPALTEEKCNFWHFRFEPHTDMQIRVLVAAIAKQPELKKLFLLNQDYAWGHSVQKAARAALREKRPDIEIVGDDLIPLAKVKDFSPYVAKIQASGADSVLTGNWGADLTLFIKATHVSGLKAELFSTHAWALGAPRAMGDLARIRRTPLRRP